MDHSQTEVTLTINGQQYQFGKFRPKDMFDVVEHLNDQAQRKAIEMIPVENIAERIEVFKATCSIYSVDNLAQLATDPRFIVEAMYRCYLRENPEADREEFLNIFSHMEVPLLELFLDRLAGFSEGASDDENPPTEAEANQSAGQPSSPPSAKPVQD